MKLPIDVKAVIEAATDIESARNTPVSVTLRRMCARRSWARGRTRA